MTWHKRVAISALLVSLAVSTCWPPSVKADETAAAAQKTFPTARAAADAFKNAILKRDTTALLDLLGHDYEDLVVGPDPAATRAELRRVAKSIRAKLSLVAEGDNKYVIVVGTDNWPLPIPVVRKNDRWRFDSAAGETEVLARRIGRNELAVIGALNVFVRAEREYAARRRASDKPAVYAGFVMSTQGDTDGLWWDKATAAKAGPSPLAQFAHAEQEFLDGRQPGDPFHGYYFRILTGQGPHAEGGAKTYVVDGEMRLGFAMIAWPAEFKTTGVMTFIVGPDGKIYEKNLGPETQSVVNTIQIYDPDSSWTRQLPPFAH